MISKLIKRFQSPKQTDGILRTDMLITGRGRRYMYIIGLFVLLFIPFANVVQTHWLNLLIRIMAFALFVAAFDFAFGFAGLYSFGHAAMFGAGGYTAGYLLSDATANIVVVLGGAVIAGLIVSALMAWISLRATEVYFAILTLALAQVVYVAVFIDVPRQLSESWATQGDNGLVGLENISVFGFELSPWDPMVYALAMFAVLAVSLAILFRLAHSKFGRVCQGIHENQERMQALGYNVWRYQMGAFMISGMFTAIAGAMFVGFQSTAHPGQLHWLMMGEALIMILLGGLGTLWGPIIGAGLFLSIEHNLSHIHGWEIIMGVLFLLILLNAKEGIAGKLQSFNYRESKDRINEKLGRTKADEETPPSDD